MADQVPFYRFLDDGSSFISSEALRSRLIYAPLCGPDGTGLKSSITPYLSGDIKIDKERYLTRPASREDLRSPVREFFVRFADGAVVSFGRGAEGRGPASVEMGPLWHKVSRSFVDKGVALEALTFVPVTGETVELTRFSVRNEGKAPVVLTATVAVPIFGRALANKHDHEHVTALLKRTRQLPEGVLVEPTMVFDEVGHRLCGQVYHVFGCTGNGVLPAGTFPTADDFLGEGGSLIAPEAVREGRPPRELTEAERNGREAMGALAFREVSLAPGERAVFIVAAGIAENASAALAQFSRFASEEAFEEALQANRTFWKGKTEAVVFSHADPDLTAWMKWVSLQPVLRRIFGCSFLPDHDYGKGGKGWRDIWQDLLSLILIEPSDVREHLLNNFSGIRIDGSNATIIGQRPGEFLADRNAITRVWMDHGVWPFVTTQLYIDQSGDADILFEEAGYFRDPQMARSTKRDASWTSADGERLRDREGKVHLATVLEHILVQNLVAFFNVGEHNITRLENADWNDGLDMAFRRGESVAFMSIYAGNLARIADLIERVAERKGLKTLTLTREVRVLLDTTTGSSVDYEDAAAKRQRLFEEYFSAVQPAPSGERVEIAVPDVIADLRRKAAWAFGHIRRQEVVSLEKGSARYRWFNGYYDNDGERVEGERDGRVRMTLTGQVFPLMSGLTTPEETRDVVHSVENFLWDKELGGVRLNTDFGVRHYLSLGRAFGFAYGTKENGAVFSHMAVMYAYGLYVQGCPVEARDVLLSLYRMSTHPTRARIYPGIPEYFDGLGRGMYHFLTGSASWFVLTLLTRAYGVRGVMGDLLLAPQLVAADFDAKGEARVSCTFAGRPITVVYQNPSRREAGQYQVLSVEAGGNVMDLSRTPAGVLLARSAIEGLSSGEELVVRLG
ncbi:MAG: cellobiose phosphorylase [Elusimicrobia bacterium]|nr:cellobiose phosphorylase [Elusimicrobiota bacterium]